MRDPAGVLTTKDKVAIIYMPLVIVILTAVLGTGIGVWLQNRSFQRNELFRAKLERIMSAQRDAVEIMREVDQARRQIRSDEHFIREQIDLQESSKEREEAVKYYSIRNPMEASVATLKDSKVKLDALGAYTSTLSPRSPVPAAIESYSNKLNVFLGCLEENLDFERVCSNEHTELVGLLHQVVVAYAKMADGLIEKYE
jgi:hypothetical protein